MSSETSRSDPFLVKVVADGVKPVKFKARDSVKVSKLVDVFCSKTKLSSSQLRFMVDGERLEQHGERTIGEALPDLHDILEESENRELVINVFKETIGGAFLLP
ncbi:MAG: hypothetical protein MHM6MM_006439 [Cercozoa sp. M6MM]